MTRKAQTMMHEAMEEMKANKGPAKYKAWKQANDKFDKAQKMYDESDKFLEKMKLPAASGRGIKTD